MVLIKGLQKLSLIDYPPYAVAMVFLAGCPWRCRFCHNPDLVLRHHTLPSISEKEFFSFLDTRKEWLDGVCISGGEPTIHPDLVSFARAIKEKGFRVKLDTMGVNPLMIKELIDTKLIDYIAMDIKSGLMHYKEVVQRDIDISRIKQSMDIIRSSDIDYEFRTTVVPGLIGKEQIALIAQSMKGSKRFFIQNFRPSKPLMDPSLENSPRFSMKELEEMRALVTPYVEEVGIRE